MTPRVLLVAWDYPHVEHATGAPVARRVHQVAQGFAIHGWAVDVIIRDHYASGSAPGVARRLAERHGDSILTIHAVAGPDGKPTERPRALRLLSTAWHAITVGDRTGRWGRAATGYLRTGAVPRPDLVIGFYTPRGPLVTAEWAHRHWDVPWMADLQDEWSQGSGPALRPLVRHWMRRSLRSARRVVQVSPEWAEMDRAALRRDVHVLRHAVPLADFRADPRARPAGVGKVLTLLYAGSLNVREQDPRPLLEAMRVVRAASGVGPSTVRLEIASSESAFAGWRKEAERVGVADQLHWLGWLDERRLTSAMHDADALVFVPLSTPERPGVPSKLFAYLGTGTPILLAGPDSGGLTSLFAEWQARKVLCAEAGQIREALERLFRGDSSMCLTLSACGTRPLDARELGQRYVSWAAELVRPRSFDIVPVGTPATVR